MATGLPGSAPISTKAWQNQALNALIVQGALIMATLDDLTSKIASLQAAETAEDADITKAIDLIGKLNALVASLQPGQLTPAQQSQVDALASAADALTADVTAQTTSLAAAEPDPAPPVVPPTA